MKNLIIDEYGNKYWYQKGKLHRKEGPAVEWSNGTKYWFQNDKLHRLDGPAIYGINGYKEWWYKGKYITCSSQEEFEKLIRLRIFW